MTFIKFYLAVMVKIKLHNFFLSGLAEEKLENDFFSVRAVLGLVAAIRIRFLALFQLPDFLIGGINLDLFGFIDGIRITVKIKIGTWFGFITHQKWITTRYYTTAGK